MNQKDMIKVMIVGAGELGTYLFDTIVDESGMILSGIVDVNGEFSSVDLAGTRNIPIFASLSEAMRTMPEIIFHLPESGISPSELLALKPPHAEIIEYQGIRFFLNMIRHSRIQTIRQVRRQTGEVSGNLTAAIDAKPSDPSDSACRAFNSTVSHKKRGVHNILCIDQNRDFLETLTAPLTTAGYRITCTQSGKEGLDDAFRSTPDLIILDLAISDIGYFEMFSALRNNPQTADVPIIILTEKDVSMGERLSLV
ncbi:MAG TPA: response regulator, partial [Smithella sp.]|nr:response regulator [Smithella sp.]